MVQNRPRPLREFDQIYMKTGDMVLQSEFVGRWAKDKRLAFIGDGDAISVCVAYLHNRGIIEDGPSRIVVFDFDERICNAVKRFADKERLETLTSVNYNVLDAFPGPTTSTASTPTRRGVRRTKARASLRSCSAAWRRSRTKVTE